MKGSFYYFFSATPQVLGGILALFGVFVIFKMQTIKTQLFGIWKLVIDKANEGRLEPLPLIQSEIPKITVDTIDMHINNLDLEGLKNPLI